MPTPLDFLDRYLARALDEMVMGPRGAQGVEEYESWGTEAREEYGVVERMETGVGRACRAKAVEA